MKPVHVLDELKKFDPFPDTWIVVGKGPSYDLVKIMETEGCLCCLNETCNQLPPGVVPELTLINDRTVLGEINPDKSDLFAVAIGPHHFAPPEEVQVPFFTSIAETLAILGDRLTYFDLRTCSHTAFPTHPKIQAHFSVYETALWILGYAGAKRILTTGVDGGCAYHRDFGERDEKYRDTDLTPQFERAEITIKQFGLIVEKL